MNLNNGVEWPDFPAVAKERTKHIMSANTISDPVPQGLILRTINLPFSLFFKLLSKIALIHWLPLRCLTLPFVVK